MPELRINNGESLRLSPDQVGALTRLMPALHTTSFMNYLRHGRDVTVLPGDELAYFLSLLQNARCQVTETYSVCAPGENRKDFSLFTFLNDLRKAAGLPALAA